MVRVTGLREETSTLADSEQSRYEDFAPVRQLVTGTAGLVHPVAGMLAAVVDALVAQRVAGSESPTARAIAQSLQNAVGLRVYENMRTLADELIGAEGTLPPDIMRSEPFMRSFAVCAELSARAEDRRKVRYLWRLLVKGVADPDALLLERDYEFYAGVVSELSMTELHILGRLAQFEQSWGYWSVEELERNPHTSSESRLVRMREWQDDFTSALRQELGLSQADLFERMDRIARTGAYSKDFLGSGGLTRIGRRLMAWIRDAGQTGSV